MTAFRAVFQNIMKRESIPCKETGSEFPGCGEAQKAEGRKTIQIFTFLCLAVAVLCGMINYLTLGTLNWFWFAARRLSVCVGDRYSGLHQTPQHPQK